MNISSECLPAVQRLIAQTSIATRKRIASMAKAAVVCVLALCAAVPAHANSPSVTFNGALTIVAPNGLPYPSGMAADSSGNIYTDANDGVQELVAVGGVVPANPTIINIIPQYSSPYTGVFLYPKKLALDSSGNIYIADEGVNSIFEIKKVGGVFPSNPTPVTLGSGFLNPYGVAVDAAGDVFVADTNHNAIKEMVAVSGAVPTSNPTINTINLGTTACLQPESVSFDTSGNLYTACTGSNTVLELKAVSGSIPATPTVVTLGSGWNMGYGSDAQVDASGNVYVIDDNVNVGDIKEMLAVGGSIPSSPTIVTLATNLTQPNDMAYYGNTLYWGEENQSNEVKSLQFGSVGYGGINVGSSTTLTLNFTTGPGVTSIAKITFLTQGAANLDFKTASGSTCTFPSQYSPNSTCTLNVTFSPTAPGVRVGAVQLLDPTTPTPNVLATVRLSGIGIGPEVGVFPGKQTTIGAGLSQPAGMTIDGSGNLYVSDFSNSRMLRIPATDMTCAIVGDCTTVGGTLNRPYSVAMDGAGYLYIADTYNSRILRVPPFDQTCATTGDCTLVGTGLNVPQGIAVDNAGNVYVSNTNSSQVLYFPATDLTCATPSDCKKLGTSFSSPYGIAVDGNGNVYVADTFGARVERLPANDLTCATSGDCYNVGLGINTPTGVTTDAAGNVYISDWVNSGRVLRVPASDLTCATASDCITVGSGFGRPLGVTLDPAGNVFVADWNSNSVYKVDITDPQALSFAATPIGSTSSDSPQTLTMENFGNAALTFTVPGSGKNPAFGGSVPASYSLNSTSAGTCPLLTTGTSSPQTLASGATCTLPISFIPTASSNAATLTVADNNLNSVTATQSFTLNGTGTGPAKGNSTLTGPTVQPVQVPLGATGSIPITVTTTGTNPPTGTVTFNIGSPCTSGCAGGASISSGVATLSTPSNLPSSIYTMTVSYAGDTNNNAASNIMVQFQPVQLTPTVSTNLSNATEGYGTNVSAFLVATTAYNSTPLTVDGTTAYTATLQPSGSPVAITTGTVLTPGVYTITATWTPNSTYAVTYKAASGSGTLTVTKDGSATVAAQTAPLPATGGTGVGVTTTFGVTVSSTVSGTPAAPTGTVQFYNGTTAIGAPVTLVNGAATLTTTFSSVQTASISAVYSGDGNYTGSTSTPFSEPIVTPGYSVTANPTSITVTRGTPVTATITFTPFGNYQGTATFGCTGLPAFSSCIFTPSTVTFSGNNAVQTATLNFYTIAPYAKPGTSKSAMLWLPAMLLGLLLMVRRRKLAAATRGLLMLCMLAFAATGMTGCGSGSYWTPTGNDSVVVNVTATGGSGFNNINQTATISITVQ